MAWKFATSLFGNRPSSRGSKVRGGAHHLGPTFSNRDDCRRFGCRETPWNWGSHWVLERAGLTGRETVVDLGAGDNPIVLPVLAKGAAKVFLVDNRVFPTAGLAANMERIVADVSVLPLADASVDVAISVSVLEHLPLGRRARAMREMARILRPGGRAVLSIGVPLAARAEGYRLMATTPFLADRGCGVFMPVDIRQLLDAACELRLADSDGVSFCPGLADFDEGLLLGDANIVLESWGDYPELARHRSLEAVKICELGLYLVRSEKRLSPALAERRV